MLRIFNSRTSKLTKILTLFIGFIAILVITVITIVRFNITGNYEGIFLLKAEHGALLEVQDDLYLGQEPRYIWGIDLEEWKHPLSGPANACAADKPCLYYEWNDKKGDGFIRNHLPGGKQLLTCFSRFVDDGGAEVSGLFVGGGLPAEVRENKVVKMNETGMAYYDGARWYHIWCNANEAISDSHLKAILPSSWKFLGSRVLHYNAEDLILESSHEVIIDEVPLSIKRNAYFKAGEPYFILSIRIDNTGDRPATYYYDYGDEPWLGNYGTSGGNVGWASDGVSNYIYKYKGRLNTKKFHSAGLFDFGNDAIGENHDFTFTANFIRWYSDVDPFVFFSNGPYDFPQMNENKVPLSSNTRFIGLQWGPQILQPGQSKTYTLAIGMADRDPKSGFPVEPQIDLKNFP